MLGQRSTRRLLRCGRGVIAGSAWLVLSFTATAAENFSARLAPVPIDPVIAKATTGLGSATAVLDGTKLKVTGTVAGLQGAATVARLHQGLMTGVRGPAIAELTVPSTSSGSFSVDLALTPEQAQGLRQGRVYIQIHSASAPDGNLWGWLLQ
jgi:hypothetical protein